MLFNSYAFVFLFFPCCLAGYYLARRCRKAAVAKGVLVLLSLWFYSFLQPANLPVLLGSMAANYGLYRWMRKKEKKEKKIPLVLGITGNLLLLFVFKYTDAPFVPLGISFFTFEQIAFLMECYRGNLGVVPLLDYGVYISFFPKLLEGPIALPEEMLGQLSREEKKPFEWEGFFRALCLFVLGLAKKVLLADTLGGAVDFGYQNLAALHTGDGLIVMLSYTLQLYFDFSGYCDMAMGIAGMLGFSLPLNFDSPYRASDIIGFWKGWHITLTRFFTRYLYIPLGGNRKGRGRTYLNTLIVFLVSGIWHGAGVTFIIWGMMHGILYVITRFLQERRKEGKPAFSGRIVKGIKIAATFLYVNVAWVFFRAPSVQEALALLKTIVSFRFEKINWDLAGCFNLDEFWYVIKVLRLDSSPYAHYLLMVLILAVALLIVFFARTAVTVSGRIKPSLFSTLLLAVLFVWCVVTFSEVSSFLYLNF